MDANNRFLQLRPRSEFTIMPPLPAVANLRRGNQYPHSTRQPQPKK